MCALLYNASRALPLIWDKQKANQQANFPKNKWYRIEKSLAAQGFYKFLNAGIAQSVEQLIRNQPRKKHYKNLCEVLDFQGLFLFSMK